MNQGKTLSKGKTANKYCSVFECKSKISNEISLHKLPTDERREQWINVLKMGKVPKNTFVCSRHFKKEDFILPDIPSERRNLKRTAIPSQNLPKSRVDKHIENMKKRKNEAADARRARYLLREAKNEIAAEVEVTENGVVANFSTSDHCLPAEVEVTENGVANLSTSDHCLPQSIPVAESKEHGGSSVSIVHGTDENSDLNYAIEILCADSSDHNYALGGRTRDIGVQVSPDMFQESKGVQASPTIINEKQFSIGDNIETNRQLNILTGIQSFDLLNAIEKNVLDVRATLNLKSKNYSLKMIHIIILVFMRLKLNVSFEFLSVMFPVSGKTCRQYYEDFLPILSYVFQTAVVWPTKSEIIQTLPKCFSKYRNTRVVIDCTEIPIEKPKCLQCAIKVYSFYKGGETIKFLLGVTPSGLVSFISHPYGGRASDKAITNQSSLYSLLDPFDSIMADKGFLIEEECESNFIKLIRPPFLRNKNQFDEKEGKLNRQVAAARVHVERCIQRIKIFKILKGKYPCRRIHEIEDIMTVIAGIVNLSNPILSDNKF